MVLKTYTAGAGS